MRSQPARVIAFAASLAACSRDSSAHEAMQAAAAVGTDASVEAASSDAAHVDPATVLDVSVDSGPLGTGRGQLDQGCLSHADCSPGLVCYLGHDSGQNCSSGPSGSCATCQGGTCFHGFECSCLPQTLCYEPVKHTCTDNGQVIVCQSVASSH